MTNPDRNPSPLGDYINQFGERYADAMTAADTTQTATAKRPRLRRMVPALGIGSVLATGAIVYAVTALPVGDKIDVVQKASAALGTGGDILHYETLIDQASPNPNMPECSAIGTTAQVWQSVTGTAQWHQVMPATLPNLPEKCKEINPGPDGRPLTGVIEIAQHGAISSTYFRDLRLLSSFRVKGTPPTGATVFGGTVGGDSQDFVSALKDLLRSGKMHVSGTQHTAYGHDALDLVATRFQHYDADPKHPNQKPNLDLTRVTTFVVDAKTFTPLHLNETDTYVRDAGPYKGTTKFVYGMQFTVYERLSKTPENEALLSIHPGPGTRSKIPESEKTPAQQKSDKDFAEWLKKHPSQG